MWIRVKYFGLEYWIPLCHFLYNFKGIVCNRLEVLFQFLLQCCENNLCIYNTIFVFKFSRLKLAQGAILPLLDICVSHTPCSLLLGRDYYHGIASNEIIVLAEIEVKQKMHSREKGKKPFFMWLWNSHKKKEVLINKALWDLWIDREDC